MSDENLGLMTAGLGVLMDQQAQTPEPQIHEGEPLSDGEVRALRDLYYAYEKKYEVQRRAYVQRCLYNRELYAGNPEPVWDAAQGLYRAPFGTVGAALTTSEEDEPETLRCINFYQGFFLTYAQLILANRPYGQFWPEDWNNPNDVEAAKQANDVIRYLDLLADRFDENYQKVFCSWHDGSFGTYSRFVVNGQRFGYKKEPIMEPFEAKVGSDSYMCKECGSAVPAEENQLGQCPNCGGPMGPESLQPAATITSQRQVGERDVPQGQTVTDIVDGLELFLPYNCKEMWQFPFIAWRLEADKALIRATYPKISEKIKGFVADAYSMSTGAGAFEKKARRQAKAVMDRNGIPQTDLEEDSITFSRVWFRAFAFHGIEDEQIRKGLLQKFPNGCFLAFADEVLCEARPEDMDAHWRICHFLPGNGQARVPVGQAMVQMQEVIDDFVNLQIDAAQATLGINFVDTRVIDPQALGNTRVSGGGFYPALGRNDVSLNEGIKSVQPAEWPAHADNLRTALGGDIPQFILGLPPAAFGGNLGGNNTAQGIQMERDQAMGRTGIHWQRLKAHLCEQLKLEVEQFAKGQQDIVAFSVPDAEGKPEEVKIDPAVLRRGKFRIKPEVDEDFPVTWAQKRNLHTFMLNSPYQPAMTSLENATEIKRTLGTEITFPGENAWKKQMEEIGILLQSAPQMDPMMGQPRSTIPVNPVLDDLQTKLLALKAWWASPAYKQAMQTNPQGVQNVALHAQEVQMALQATMAPPPGMEGAPGGPPSSPQGAPSAPPEGPQGGPPTDAAPVQ